MDTSSISRALCGKTLAVEPALHEFRRGRAGRLTELSGPFSSFWCLCLFTILLLIIFVTNAKWDRNTCLIAKAQLWPMWRSGIVLPRNGRYAPRSWPAIAESTGTSMTSLVVVVVVDDAVADEAGMEDIDGSAVITLLLPVPELLVLRPLLKLLLLGRAELDARPLSGDSRRRMSAANP